MRHYGFWDLKLPSGCEGRRYVDISPPYEDDSQEYFQMIAGRVLWPAKTAQKYSQPEGNYFF
jgi:hypothetical protein